MKTKKCLSPKAGKGNWKPVFFRAIKSEADWRIEIDPQLAYFFGFPKAIPQKIEDFFSLLPKRTSEAWREAFQKAIAGQRTNFKFRLTAPRRGEISFEAVLIPILEGNSISTIEGALFPKRTEKERGGYSEENHYQSLFLNLPVGVFRTTMDGKLLKANPALVKILGYSSEEELLSIPVQKHYLEPVQRQEFLEALLKKKELINREFKLKRKDGRTITVRENSYLVKSRGNNGPFIEGILVDITQEKEKEEKIKILEEERALILDSLEESISLHDKNRRILWANKAALKNLNLPLEKAIGKVCYKLWYRRNKPCEGCPVEQALKNGTFKFAEVMTPDLRWWLSRAVPIKDEHGEIQMVVDAALDITRLKKAEEESRIAHANLEAIIANSPLAISVRKPSGDLVFVNEAWRKLWGVSEEQVWEMEQKSKSEPFPERIPYLKEYIPKIKEIMKKGGKLWIPEVKVTGVGPREGAWLSLYFYSLKGKDGKVDRIVTMTQDLSQTKFAQEEIRKAKEDFFYSVSHELKTPVLALLSALELVGSSPPETLGKRFREYEPILKRNLDRLLALIENLIESQKTAEHLKRINLAPIDLVVFLKDILEDFKPYAQTKGVSFSLKTKGEIPPIHLDPDGMRKAISNLVSNAIKFSPNGKKVSVGVGIKGGSIEIAIADQGSGIPPEDQKQLFNPFYRGKNLEGKSIPGTGLGLYVSKLIIERHGGKILLESSPGKGTKILLKLPLGVRNP
ncbi:MAG: PAS domain-containing sensor histidine kinase [Caldiserica bacterium]|jgi:PAS domain S-box-containing protein|nr:PAS domain-containing sensor histidine kinase [Caldisericota bacterium]MDH7562700.1 PAS domain-containing sensor histidine kinase [Caldisericota bacterium]